MFLCQARLRILLKSMRINGRAIVDAESAGLGRYCRLRHPLAVWDCSTVDSAVEPVNSAFGNGRALFAGCQSARHPAAKRAVKRFKK